MASVTESQERVVMVVVGHVMAVTVHRPVEVFLESMRMPVIGDYFEMVLDRLEDRGRMGRGGRDGPDDQRQAEKRCKCMSSECRQWSNHSCLSADMRRLF